MKALLSARKALSEHERRTAHLRVELDELVERRREVITLDDIVHVRSWRSPPIRVQNVMLEMLTQLGVKTTSWTQTHLFLNREDPQTFLETLRGDIDHTKEADYEKTSADVMWATRWLQCIKKEKPLTEAVRKVSKERAELEHTLEEAQKKVDLEEQKRMKREDAYSRLLWKFLKVEKSKPSAMDAMDKLAQLEELNRRFESGDMRPPVKPKPKPRPSAPSSVAESKSKPRTWTETKQIACFGRQDPSPYMQYCSIKPSELYVTDTHRFVIPMDKTDEEVLICGSPVFKIQTHALARLVDFLRNNSDEAKKPVCVLLGDKKHLVEKYLREHAKICPGQIRLSLPTTDEYEKTMKEKEEHPENEDDEDEDEESEEEEEDSTEGDDDEVLTEEEREERGRRRLEKEAERWHGPKVEAYFPREIRVKDGLWSDDVKFPPEDPKFERSAQSIGIMANVIRLHANNILIVEGHADEGITCKMLLHDLSLARADDVATFLGKCTTIGRGAEHKLYDDFGESSKNRRVVFFLEEKPVQKVSRYDIVRPTIHRTPSLTCATLPRRKTKQKRAELIRPCTPCISLSY